MTYSFSTLADGLVLKVNPTENFRPLWPAEDRTFSDVCNREERQVLNLAGTHKVSLPESSVPGCTASATPLLKGSCLRNLHF